MAERIIENLECAFNEDGNSFSDIAQSNCNNNENSINDHYESTMDTNNSLEENSKKNTSDDACANNSNNECEMKDISDSLETASGTNYSEIIRPTKNVILVNETDDGRFFVRWQVGNQKDGDFVALCYQGISLLSNDLLKKVAIEQRFKVNKAIPSFISPQSMWHHMHLRNKHF